LIKRLLQDSSLVSDQDKSPVSPVKVGIEVRTEIDLRMACASPVVAIWLHTPSTLVTFRFALAAVERRARSDNAHEPMA